MIYLLHGDNFIKLRNKVRDILASVTKKNPDASYFKLSSDNWSKEKLEEFIGGQGLFQSKYTVVLDGLISHKESAPHVTEALEEISVSPNIFIITEENLTKESLKKISKYAEKTQEFLTGKKIKKIGEDFNVFSLTDAFGARDKKRLWILYQSALKNSMEPKEIHRLLFWQVKAMIAARNSKGAKESGLNPFVYRKALGFSKNFTKEELNTLSSRLVSLYHDSRRGILDFDIALERFLLEI
jgi:DNA polymerase III delta subunit